MIKARVRSATRLVPQPADGHPWLRLSKPSELPAGWTTRPATKCPCSTRPEFGRAPPQLLVLGAYDPDGDDEDPLSLRPHRAQYHGEAPPPEPVLKETWSDIITRRIFGQRHPARWVILLSPSQVLLLERGKWTHNRLLRFVLDDIMGRRETPTLQATAALLHRESLVPDEGMSLLDSLDDNSHRHAFAVSADLKHALRESIELIGNEAIRYLREVRKERVYRLDDKLAGKLGQEALRYMYRLLFLFYIEARPELGYAPVDSEAYRKGYSLEHLRDLELVRLTGGESLNGCYIHESVQTLFRLIRDGFDGGDPNFLAGSLHNTFQIRALDSALFREGATPLLDGVKFRNEILQQVIRLMSLTRPAKGRSRRRGRISYAQLGINQLGAVYEALLSYRGFFAEEDLYEVKQAGKDPDELENAWFVPLSELHKYSQEERVFERGAERSAEDQGPSQGPVHLPAGRAGPREDRQLLHPGEPDSVRREVRPQGADSRRQLPASGFWNSPSASQRWVRRRLPQRGRQPARGEVPGPAPT